MNVERLYEFIINIECYYMSFRWILTTIFYATFYFSVIKFLLAIISQIKIRLFIYFATKISIFKEFSINSYCCYLVKRKKKTLKLNF